MKYKIVRNETGLTTNYIQHLLLTKGVDYVKDRFIGGLTFFTAEDYRKVYPSKVFKKRDKSLLYKDSELYEYYIKFGTLEKLANILGISKQRVHQILTSAISYKTLYKYTNILNRHEEGLK